MNSNQVKIEELQKHRLTGARGTLIEMHHSFRHIALSNVSLLSILLLPLFFDLILWLNLDLIISFWDKIFNTAISVLEIKGSVSNVEILFPGRLINMPFPNIEAASPSIDAVLLNLIICITLFALSFFISKSYLPISYFLRALIFIQTSSSIYFLIKSDEFPY
ncbi:MAG: hypothetical protein WCJ33_07070, partial [Pseudomonadota bacterium]